MIIRALALALFFMLGALARAESALDLAEGLDLSGAQAVIDDSGETFSISDALKAFASGEFELDAERALSYIRSALNKAIREALPFMGGAALPLIIWAFVSKLLPGAKTAGARAAGYACYLACALALIGRFTGVHVQAESAIAYIAALTDALTPLLVSLLALTGGTRSASLITPMGALASRLIALVIQYGALTLCGVGAALAAASGIGGWMKLKRLTALVKSFAKWLLGAMLGAYLALMSTGGLIRSAYDGVTLKGAKYAADNLLPIIGGSVAGTMESLAASASLLRGAVGLTGSLALVSVCAKPMLAAAVASVACRFLSAIAEPVADEDMLGMLDAFSGAFSMLLAVIASAAALLLILIGATIGMGARLMG